MNPDREELRRRLREKIAGKRKSDNVQQLAQKLKSDPQTAFLSMGIDDKDLLSKAQSITKNPHKALKDLANLSNDTKNSTKELTENRVEEDDDEEDLPPAQI